jgi:hypothetical protein
MSVDGWNIRIDPSPNDRFSFPSDAIVIPSLNGYGLAVGDSYKLYHGYQDGLNGWSQTDYYQPCVTYTSGLFRSNNSSLVVGAIPVDARYYYWNDRTDNNPIGAVVGGAIGFITGGPVGAAAGAAAGYAASSLSGNAYQFSSGVSANSSSETYNDHVLLAKKPSGFYNSFACTRGLERENYTTLVTSIGSTSIAQEANINDILSIF